MFFTILFLVFCIIFGWKDNIDRQELNEWRSDNELFLSKIEEFRLGVSAARIKADVRYKNGFGDAALVYKAVQSSLLVAMDRAKADAKLVFDKEQERAVQEPTENSITGFLLTASVFYERKLVDIEKVCLVTGIAAKDICNETQDLCKTVWDNELLDLEDSLVVCEGLLEELECKTAGGDNSNLERRILSLRVFS